MMRLSILLVAGFVAGFGGPAWAYNTAVGSDVAVALPSVDFRYQRVIAPGNTILEGADNRELPPGYAEIAGSEPLQVKLAPHKGPVTIVIRYHLNDDLLPNWEDDIRLLAAGIAPQSQMRDVTIRGSVDKSRMSVSGEISQDSYLVVARFDPRSPGKAKDIQVAQLGYNYVNLLWIAPGDDGDVGRLYDYEIRCSTDSRFLNDFARGILCGPCNMSMPVEEDSDGADDCGPGEPGGQDGANLGGLLPDTTYYFGIKGIDSTGNSSIAYSSAIKTLPWYVVKSSETISGQPWFEFSFEYRVLAHAGDPERRVLDAAARQGIRPLSPPLTIEPQEPCTEKYLSLAMRYDPRRVAELGVSTGSIQVLRYLTSEFVLTHLGEGGRIISTTTFPAGSLLEVWNQGHDPAANLIQSEIECAPTTFLLGGKILGHKP